MADLDISNTINIIGEDSQTIHIILKRNEKININKNYILYASSDNLDEITYKNVGSLIRYNTSTSIFSLTKDNSLKRVESDSIVRLKNKENNIEYIGLSKGGKIMKITPLLYNNLFIRVENILAFNDGMEILKDSEMDQKMNKLIQKNNFQFGLRDLIDMYLFNKSEYCLAKSKLNSNSFSFTDTESLSLINLSSYINDFVYISGRRNLIEKRLGENESMVLMASSLIAFEQTVSLNNIKRDVNNNNKYVNNLNDIIVEGPGLIIFELSERRIPMTNPMGNRVFILLTIALFIVEIIAQFFVHYNLRQ